MARLRRRSTLEWANASPQRRQEKLESVIEERLADVFFSLHVGGVEGQLERNAWEMTDVLTVHRAYICLRDGGKNDEPHFPLD